MSETIPEPAATGSPPAAPVPEPTATAPAAAPPVGQLVGVSPGSPFDLPAGYDPLTLRYWVGKLDLRPLALFRWGLGIFILYDLCDMLPDARTWFSDEGVLPLPTLLTSWARSDRFSLLDAFNWLPLTYAYFAFAFAVVICLIIGYRTRLMSVLTFLLIASIQERCPPMFDGSDDVIRLLSAWHMFCPSGNVWSVDALLAERRGKPLAREGCALFIRLIQVQIAWIYLDTVIRKMKGSSWIAGDALHYGLHLNHVFGRTWAAALAEMPPVVMALSWFTLAMEWSYPFLTILPSVTLLRMASTVLPGVDRARDRLMPGAIAVNKYGRLAAVLLAVGLHLGITFTINVGHFNYLMPTVQVIFLEPAWAQRLWDAAKRFLGARRVAAYQALALWFPAPLGYEPPTTGPLAGGVRRLKMLVGAAGLGLFVLCVWYSAPEFARPPIPDWVTNTVDALDVWASWDMFSPDPPKVDYHLTAPAEFEDGTRGNLFGGAPEGPGEVRGAWDNRWWKYWESLGAGSAPLPLEWGRYVCREHNNHLKPGQPRLYTFTLYEDNQLIPPFDQPWPPVVRNTSWNHYCYDKPKPASAPAEAPSDDSDSSGDDDSDASGG
jgi:hypothetical protein